MADGRYLTKKPFTYARAYISFILIFAFIKKPQKVCWPQIFSVSLHSY